jgi:hypothetical protein
MASVTPAKKKSEKQPAKKTKSVAASKAKPGLVKKTDEEPASSDDEFDFHSDNSDPKRAPARAGRKAAAKKVVYNVDDSSDEDLEFE